MVISPKRAFEEGWISNVLEDTIQPNGIDLTISTIQTPQLPDKIVISQKILPSFIEYLPTEVVNGCPAWLLSPEESPYFLINCDQMVSIPSDVIGLIIKRSTLNRTGTIIQSGLYDSGFRGRVGFTVIPTVPIYVFPGSRLAQFVFMTSDEAVHRLYDGSYQNQDHH